MNHKVRPDAMARFVFLTRTEAVVTSVSQKELKIGWRALFTTSPLDCPEPSGVHVLVTSSPKTGPAKQRRIRQNWRFSGEDLSDEKDGCTEEQIAFALRQAEMGTPVGEASRVLIPVVDWVRIHSRLSKRLSKTIDRGLIGETILNQSCGELLNIHRFPFIGLRRKQNCRAGCCPATQAKLYSNVPETRDTIISSRQIVRRRL
jgi:hypothetical protein